ncbi:UvrD-helicase domain-containing protein [Aquibacillus albus]|uniref:DNA 3'-5' helicase n=1 Tax=Aquibacillus albus TaxID=1168171 RepID=A0ABS2N460_9BACI|nr:UvrD-helicase domain-containing protein [Aquibacillus albus]MBM7572932.1 ATP-dependent exoDNAse (exonuclease V) beta subunit [Aquibacillus albus]
MTGKLKMLSAGAGAGKTTRLTSEILQSIQHDVPPENIVATTFTKKAADELMERVRIKLLAEGDATAAARILDGYMGTMNSVFGRLLKEFALEMGLSPVQKVLEDSEANTLFESVATDSIDKFDRDYRLVFFRLGLEDFPKTVLNILRLARENGMDSTDVKRCADYSWTRMNVWLPDPLDNAKELDQALRDALTVAIGQFPIEDNTKATTNAMNDIKAALHMWERYGTLSWQLWAKLMKLKPGAKSREVVSPIHAAASIQDRHPRLHEDLKHAMFALFHCAAEAMDTYAEEKGKRGLIDFTDQEALALKLLQDETYQERLKDRITEVFVDEFQDSSPLQIALNMQLREIADKATWVGDVKQAIYGFRGTDPELMNTAMESIPDLDIEVLDKSYRSRKSLVTFVNDLFVPIFKTKGMTKEKVALDPKRDDKPEQALAIETWSYSDSKNQTADAQHLAFGVKKVLRNRDDYLVVDKMTRDLRTLKPGDIAILCRANEDCWKVAGALSQIGIPATVGENGLMATREVVFAVAAFRYLIDSNDTLALAEIIHFSSEKWGEGRWLSEWLDEEKRMDILKEEEPIQRLDTARGKINQMSPSEVLDMALVAANVDEVTLRWGDGEQRLANVDALRKLATQFEEISSTNGTVATTSGFLFFLDRAEQDKNLNLVAESADENAVRVLTYHKAKGLEWPFVILNSLEKSSGRSKPPVFDQVTAVSTTAFQVEAPLEGRQLFYWPWPYGKQTAHVSLDGYVEKAPELHRKKQLDLEENQRLMYVGMTRARDYLVFATRDFSKIGWLDELSDESGQPVLGNLGVEDEADDPENLGGTIFVNGEAHPCKVRNLSIEELEEEETIESEASFVYVGKRGEQVQFESARFRPSGHAEELLGDGENLETEKAYGRIHRIGTRLPLAGSPDMALLGEVIHDFLAADDPTKGLEERLAMARAIRERYDTYAISEQSMVQAANCLEAFVAQEYPDIIERHDEWPIHLRKGLQKASGWIDMLIQTPKGWVIIDHKSFPGKESDWLTRATSHLPQLQTYAEAIYKATGKPVYEVWIHMPIVGAMIHFAKEDLKLPVLE